MDNRGMAGQTSLCITRGHSHREAEQHFSISTGDGEEPTGPRVHGSEEERVAGQDFGKQMLKRNVPETWDDLMDIVCEFSPVLSGQLLP